MVMALPPSRFPRGPIVALGHIVIGTPMAVAVSGCTRGPKIHVTVLAPACRAVFQSTVAGVWGGVSEALLGEEWTCDSHV